VKVYKIPELLAPAGSIEAFWAAFNAGADAFYLGFGEFNARKRAKNFSTGEFSLAANLAHKYGKKIYVAMNTLAFNSDIPAIVDYIEIAKENLADAIIVQDWGLLSILREHYTEIPVHASTQMFCHNSLHAGFLKENGVSRIILPRELSLEEIEKIYLKTGVELEVFVHGAMCFSFSGCCLFSSFLYGDSGNLGRCRQPCRYGFMHGGETVYPFSMKDLCA
jgi:U32 family peptidase